MARINGETILLLTSKGGLALNRLKRFFTGEAAAEKELNKLAKLRILLLESSWRPTLKMRDANLEGKKLAIRDAKAMRGAASQAELKWMQENADKATKVYKSGTREFGGNANRLALLKARQEAMKPFISQEAGKIRRNRAIATILGTAGLTYALKSFEPTSFYLNDLSKGVQANLGLNPKSTTRTEKDMSDSFNNQIQDLAALAIASGLDGLTPWVYQVYNKSHGREAKYADFSNPLKFLNPGQRVEYSDGGMAMSKSKNKNGYDVVLTDEAAWDPDEGDSYSTFSPRGLPIALGVTKENLGDNIDKMRYTYNIPSEKVDSMRNVYNKYSKIIKKERKEKK